MPTENIKQHERESNPAYDAMCAKRAEFIESYRLWLATSPMPGHVNDETYATISQLRQLRDLWTDALPPATQPATSA